MFRRIHYDGSKIYLWETLPDGKNNREIFDHEIEYYTPDETGTSSISDIYGTPVKKNSGKNKSTINDLIASGITVCEADLQETTKFLQKRYADKVLKPDMSIFKIGVLDIEVESGTEFPYASEAKYPINLIGLKNLKTNKIYAFGNRPYTGNNPLISKYMHCPDEKDLLTNFIEFFRRCSFDILTGWNVLDFDIQYILNRQKQLGIEKSMSPIDSVYQDDKGHISIGGLNVLDYQAMYKGFLKIPMSSYSLNNVCMTELGEGKMELEGSVNQAYKTDWNAFVDYNAQDIELVAKLDQKRKLIHLCVTLGYQALIPFDKTLATIPLVEGYILKALHKNNMVMNSRTDSSREEYAGGYCFANPGFYYDVLSFDVESLYPHLIMAYNISPETLVKNPANTEGLIRSPVEGIFYRKDKKGIIPEIVKGIFNDRKMFKTRGKVLKLFNKGTTPDKIAESLKMPLHAVARELEIIAEEQETPEYYDVMQYVRKILINSIYGCLASPFFHYYNINNAKAITIGGQTLIKYLAQEINKYLKETHGTKNDPVIIVDTDSCYVTMDEINRKKGITFKNTEEKVRYYVDIVDGEFAVLFNRILGEYADKYNIDQIINFKHEKIITKQAVFIKKHYISEAIYNEGITYDKPKMKYTGVQTVRSDTPEFCRGKLISLIDLIFKTENRALAVEKVIEMRELFMKEPIKNIASTKGLNKYDEYVKPMEEYMREGISFPSACPIQIKAAISYNYLIEKLKLPLIPAHRGAKLKFIYVTENNVCQTHAIGFIGNWPEIFDRIFKIDYDTQFEKTFMPIIHDLFKIMKWEPVNYEECILDNILS